ncbi:MAG: sigma-70 family RNA polymerase sigma factor [bacterium]|nr:sigma-70 family RNA polymerase sigma factor [bacterium]
MRETPWLQALFVPDREGSLTHLLVLMRHALPMPPESSPADERLDAHERDLRLVRSASAESPRKAQELAERLSCVPAMVRARHRKIGSPLDEEELTDVIQDTLVAVWAKLDRFQGRSTLETWVYGFVVRELYKGLDRYRRAARRVDFDGSEIEAVADDEKIVDADEYRIVHDSIQTIGPPGSDIIRLKHFELLTFEQIGEQLDMPTNTVKTRYYRGVNRLRSLLRSYWRES